MTIQDKDLLLVGVPEHHKCLTINLSDDGKKIYLFVESPGTRYEISYDLPEGNWEPVGLYPGLTDEQAAKCVHKIPTVSRFLDYSKPYTGSINVFCSDIPHFYTALESFASRMEALGAYIKNPMGEKPSINWQSQNSAEKSIQQWNNYQSRTSGQFLILKKK